MKNQKDGYEILADQINRSKPQHTPTPPCELCNGTGYFKSNTAEFEGECPNNHGWIESVNGEATRTLNEVAFYAGPNAAFIVRAVNAYEDMLLALEETKRYLIKTGVRDARSYVEQITEAIAKAEGK